MSVPQDPMILLSFINMKLRDFYSSLENLCDQLDLNKDELVHTLSSIGYHYNEEQNKFTDVTM